MAIRTQQAVMLFNCGEDVQRQLMAQPQITHGRINRIFITDLSSANINGLAGESLLITLLQFHAPAQVLGVRSTIHVLPREDCLERHVMGCTNAVNDAAVACMHASQQHSAAAAAAAATSAGAILTCTLPLQ